MFNEIFHITGNDIKELRDDDLRELIGLLCESDFRKGNLSTAGITWGGSQDASDGGLDVVVRGNIQPPENGHIPRKITGFQVKKPAMGPAEITKEMKPNGILRDSIRELISNGGSYIIVCSRTSNTDSAMKKRTDAMRAAVADIAGHGNLHLDFYDCGRIATWVRGYPTIVIWVKERLGRPVPGWQPYGNWSESPDGIEEVYIFDDGLKIFLGTKEGDKGEKAIDAVQLLRDKLSQEKTCLRLVGFSGVGKTRFVQVLFDETVGDKSLDRTRAIYTNMSDGPIPEPVALAKYLINEKSRAILVIDNCPPDLHKRLANVCAGSNSTISLLTVEYDVRDNLPEETEVVRLEPASEELIEKLIKRRFTYISQLDIRTIANFSGGNARVAIALANTVKQGEALGRLRDEELFNRLFHQTNAHNDDLLQCAEVLSLVYSFEGTDIDSEKSELKVLSYIIEYPIIKLFRNLSELQKRQLVQCRSAWRAVLPHAIGNRLAAQALKAIPKSRILDTFMRKGNERLLRSFTRRLSFLHDNTIAREIVCEWLAPKGWLGGTNGDLNELGKEVLMNIAPVAPKEVLLMMELWAKDLSNKAFITSSNDENDEYLRILNHIAYEPDLFTRCVFLICQFALAEDPSQNQKPAEDILKTLFQISLSGTHASTEIRAKTIQELWGNEKDAEQELALTLLDAAFETLYFTNYHESRFGARSRDWGWHPTNRKDIVNWYKTFISLGLSFSFSEAPHASKARKILASNFRGMWVGTRMYKELAAMCDQLVDKGAWNEGWIAVKQAIYFDDKKGATQSNRLLRQIEKSLKPRNLLQRARAYALADESFIYDLQDIEQVGSPTKRKNRKEIKQTVDLINEDIGKEVSKDDDVLQALLPELVSTRNIYLASFGKGLADGAPDKMKLWQKFRTAYYNIQKEHIQISCLGGLLASESMHAVREEIMDSLVIDPLLAEFYPIIQIYVTISPQALARLHRSLDLGKAPISRYENIAWGKSHETINDNDLVTYVRKIMLKDQGIIVALEIIHMRFFSSEKEHSESILELARDILSEYPFKNDHSRYHVDHASVDLAKKCLLGPKAKSATINLCQNLKLAILERRINIFDYPLLLGNIAENQPSVFLDTFLSDEARADHRLKEMFSWDIERSKNPSNRINHMDVINWCEIDPAIRYPKIASSINAFVLTSERNVWSFNPLVNKIIDRSVDLPEILKAFETDLLPRSWSGSRAHIIRQRATVFCELYGHENKVVVSWAKACYDKALLEAQNYQEWEDNRDKAYNETFE